MNTSPPAFPQLAERFAAQRRAFAADPNPPLAVRRQRLDRLLALIDDNERRYRRGRRRFRRPRRAGDAHRRIVRDPQRHPLRAPTASALDADAPRADRAAVPAGAQPPRAAAARRRRRRFAVELSHPVDALSASRGAGGGDRALIKPSELTPRVSALLAELATKYFDPDLVSVVVGDAETGKAFVALPFDHLLFTGSTTVGRQVAAAAAANLTPVTLELGGKSPAIFDPSCDLAQASARVAAGKLFNAGQTCVAPDYLLVPRGQADAAAAAMAAAMTRLYPKFAANPDYTAIISERHRNRLVALVAEAREAGARIVEINPAGESFADSRKLAPTLVIGAPQTSRLMREEIFGPLLPIVEYERIDDAIATINHGERPLALYWFGRDAARRKRVLRETIAGGVTVNDCLLHFVQEGQPCGGVGASGVGAYHGEWGFRTFSKLKPVFHQSNLSGFPLLRPPYGKMTDWVLGALRLLP